MSVIKKRLYFLREIYSDRPGSQTILAFNRSLEKVGVVPVNHQPDQRLTNIARHLDEKGYLRNFFHIPRRAYIVALMWPKMARVFPVGFVGEVIPLCIDCWPADYDLWEELFLKHRVKVAFFTARQSKQYFQKKIPEMSTYWLPEAADPLEYPFSTSLQKRSVDVLELGRRCDVYHQRIVDRLRKEGCSHLYVKDSQRRMFPTREELMKTWAKTKISVCFPKSLTSQKRSGGVETVTFRYFESMASRCLIVGKCPAELADIFGYNPVIEANLDNPADQLLSILKGIDMYQDMVEKNYKTMMELGSWDSRVRVLTEKLGLNGYYVSRSGAI